MSVTYSSPPAVPTASPVTVRLLPREEWGRLLDPDIESPFRDYGLPSGEGWRIIVAEKDGRIVGLSCLYDAVHWDGWWFADGMKKNPSAVRQMLRIGRDELQAHGVSGVFSLIDTAQDDQYRAMVVRLGFTKADGQLYFLDLDRLPEGL